MQWQNKLESVYPSQALLSYSNICEYGVILPGGATYSNYFKG